ncbi:MAG: IS3 family transposase [Clostridia bacterium]|nr:IS3 family transposase [Clostridia bacterium]
MIERFRNTYSITEMCKIFEVARSSYYAWRKRQREPDRDQETADKIKEIWNRSKQTYGCRRMWKYFREKLHIPVNIKKIRRIMRKYGISSVIRRRKTYTCHKNAVHKYQNLLARQFRQEHPNTFWVTDITYIHTSKGFVYLCAVMDLCGRKILAWRVGDDMTTTLVTDTIRNALAKEKVTVGLTLHSDQGSQYTSNEYFDLIQLYHIQPSMSSPGCPYDNAAMENFFGTLKCECLNRMKFSDRAEVEAAVAEYMYFYNFERINIENGLTPDEIRSKAA